MEEISPFPYEDLAQSLKLFEISELVFVQEEHMNQGCFNYVRPRIDSLLKYLGFQKRGSLQFVGRDPCSAPATGYSSSHDKELEKFLNEAFA